MKARKEDAGVRACRHLREMAVSEMIRRLSDRYGAHGTIRSADLCRACEDVESAIADFEQSPTGPSSRNPLVLGLIRRVCTDRLRAMARAIERARDDGRDLQIDDLRFGG